MACYRASPVTQQWRICLQMQEVQIQPLGKEDPLEEEMATHSSILDGIISLTEEPGGLQSMSLQRVGHDWSNWGCTYMACYGAGLQGILLRVDMETWFGRGKATWSMITSMALISQAECSVGEARRIIKHLIYVESIAIWSMSSFESLMALVHPITQPFAWFEHTGTMLMRITQGTETNKIFNILNFSCNLWLCLLFVSH